MINKYIECLVNEFAKSEANKLEKTYKIEGTEKIFYKVTIEKHLPEGIIESWGLESNSNSISALPSGNQCGCCNGSGRSS